VVVASPRTITDRLSYGQAARMFYRVDLTGIKWQRRGATPLLSGNWDTLGTDLLLPA
jgi:hypothetical protein